MEPLEARVVACWRVASDRGRQGEARHAGEDAGAGADAGLVVAGVRSYRGRQRHGPRINHLVPPLLPRRSVLADGCSKPLAQSKFVAAGDFYPSVLLGSHSNNITLGQNC